MKRLPLIILLSLAVTSCGVSRTLKEGEYALLSNRIEFASDCDIPVSELHSSISLQPSYSPFKPTVLDQGALKTSCNAIEKKLQSLGYYGSSVDTQIDTSGRYAKVRYIVSPGSIYIIDDITFVLPQNPDFRADFYGDESAMPALSGQVLRQSTLLAEAARCAGAMRRKGYYALDRSNIHFVADTSLHDGHASLEYIIDEQDFPIAKVSFGEVAVSFPSELRFRKSVINELNLLKPGMEYNEKLVEDTYNRFAALKMFSGVAVEMTQQDAKTVDCEISLTPSSLQGFKANLETSTNSNGLFGISPQLTFFHKNIFGGGEWLNLGFTGNFQFLLGTQARSDEFVTSVNLSLPRFLGLRNSFFKGPNVPRTEFNAYFGNQNRPEYWRNIISTSMGYSGRISKYSYQLFPLQFSYVRMRDLSPKFKEILFRNPQLRYSYEDHFDAGIGGYLLRSSTTEAVPSTDYSTMGLGFDLSGNLIHAFDPLLEENNLGQKLILNAPYAQYARAELNLAGAKRFGYNDRFSLAARLVAGAGFAYGNSETLPYEKQFYVGGSSSMRGWQARSLGPGKSPIEETFSIPSQTGDLKAELDVELRYPLFWKMEGALFLEAGNVWNSSAQYSALQMLESLASDWGLGIRTNLDFLLVRVDLGIQLRDPVQELWYYNPVNALKSRAFAIHFGVGYPF